jgi:hypothetical protein
MHLVVVVLSDSRTDQFLKGQWGLDSVLGVAPQETNRVYLFWDRIARRAEEEFVLPQIVLGRVLAHEIGHHMLPQQGHSDTGIMRPTLNYQAHKLPAFTDAQAESIRKLLTEGSLAD